MAKKYISTFFCLMMFVCSYSVFAQKFTADDYFKFKDYNRALEGYLEQYKQDSSSASNIRLNYNIGVCYLNINSDKTQAIPYFEYVYNTQGYEKELTPKDKFIIYIGLAYTYAYRFDDAIKFFNMYKSSNKYKNLDLADYYIDKCESAKALIKNPLNITFNNLGPNVNSKYPDFFPFVTHTNPPAIYFTTSREKNVRKRKSSVGFYTTDVYYSTLENGKWSKASSVGNMVNTIEDEQCVYVTPNGETLLLSLDTDKFFGDLFHSSPVQGRTGLFSQLKIFEMPINTKRMEYEGCITEDMNTMIISRKGKKGFGETDLYMYKKKEDGAWGEAINLGSNVNTAYKESFPVYDEKNGILYFASEGHINMGGFDIFKSNYDSITHTFGLAENLGYPINTPEDNMQISISENGEIGYMSAYRKEGMGDLDIYQVTFNDVVKRNRQKIIKPGHTIDSLAFVYVFVRDVTTGQNKLVQVPVSDNVKYSVLEMDEVRAINLEINENKLNDIPLTNKEAEDLLFKLTGYSLDSLSKAQAANFAITQANSVSDSKMIDQQPTEGSLLPILFEFSSQSLTNEGKEQLEKVYSYLNSNKDVNLKILGFTDSFGTEEKNKDLATRRAIEVKLFLVKKGIDPSRLKAIGKGEIGKDNQEGDKNAGKLNRKVEFEVISEITKS